MQPHPSPPPFYNLLLLVRLFLSPLIWSNILLLLLLLPLLNRMEKRTGPVVLFDIGKASSDLWICIPCPIRLPLIDVFERDRAEFFSPVPCGLCFRSGNDKRCGVCVCVCVAVVPGMRSKRACLCSFATAHEQSPSRQIIETDIAGTGSNFQRGPKTHPPLSPNNMHTTHHCVSLVTRLCRHVCHVDNFPSDAADFEEGGKAFQLD